MDDRHEWMDRDEDGDETPWVAEGGVLMVGGSHMLEGSGPAAREIVRLAKENADLRKQVRFMEVWNQHGLGKILADAINKATIKPGGATEVQSAHPEKS